MIQRIKLASLGLILLAAACGPLARAAFKEPEIQLSGLRIGGLGLKGGLVYVKLHIENPNSFDIESLNLTYDLQLRDPEAEARGGDGWVSLAQGSFDETVEVRGESSTEVEIPVRFTFEGMSGALRALRDTGILEYRVSGTVTVSKPVKKVLRYRHQGSVDAAEFVLR
ncbi:MAG TPA: LEA type 2 family protein [Longimicrobiales bacterium]